jgi:hypothetical protein
MCIIFAICYVISQFKFKGNFEGFCTMASHISLPDGEKFYRQCIKFHTCTDLTPQEIHDMGLREVERIEKAMNEAC